VKLIIIAGIISLSCVTVTHAFDNGQYQNLDPKIRDWFKSVRSKNGVPCCDIADGHRTTWRGTSEGGYEVPIAGEWRKVPPEAIVLNAGNPTGEAIVWYVKQGENVYYIRCFVPGGGV
jgi:hypothetical protein